MILKASISVLVIVLGEQFQEVDSKLRGQRERTHARQTLTAVSELHSYIVTYKCVRHLAWHLAKAREYLLTSVASTVSRRIFIYIRGSDAYKYSNVKGME